MTAPCSPALQEVTPYSKGLCPPGKQTGNYKKVVFVKRTEKHFKLFICIYLLHGRSMLSFIKTKESHEVKTFVKTTESCQDYGIIRGLPIGSPSGSFT